MKISYAAVYKTGEKEEGVFVTRGPKPQGFSKYSESEKGNALFKEYIENTAGLYKPGEQE